ncbi:MAG: methyl-accepting chemotaxis protein [Lachnospiraceae bacterium]|nr:methyl-accepting chemotaxis protein [Lachnospiraceae bacterium]
MKKLFAKANLSFMIALQMLVLPAVICLIISIVMLGKEMNSTYNDAEGLYYDTLYQINNKLVNADRDYYQAMNAAQQYLSVTQSNGSLPEEIMTQLYAAREATYQENLDQTIERVNGANDIAKTIPSLYTGISIEGKTYKDYSEEFNTNYNAWLNVYDFTTQEGDITAFNEDFEVTRDSISGMTDVVEKWAEEEEAIAKKEIKSKIVTLSIIFAVVIALIYLLVLATAKSLSDGVKRVESGINNMSDGDFVTHLEVESPIKEFRGIAQASENMRHNLHEALKKIILSAQNVDDGANTAKDRISDSQNATADISQAVSDLANGATAMATDVQSAAGITQDIGNAVEDVLDAANSNLENGRNVMDESIRVQKELGDLVTSGQNTQQKANQVSESVSETAAVVAKISQAADLIISIANQTNLLALNASIEAARAGEAGRGFAVVADNIKDLAEESNDAANEISGMLKQITDLSDQNKTLTDAIKKATEDEAEALNSMSNSFEKMLDMLHQTEEGNNRIVGLVETLEGNKNSIMESVESLSSVSEQNAASTQQTSASLSMLDGNMVNVVEQAENLKNVAQELRENVKMFNI